MPFPRCEDLKCIKTMLHKGKNLTRNPLSGRNPGVSVRIGDVSVGAIAQFLNLFVVGPGTGVSCKSMVG